MTGKVIDFPTKNGVERDFTFIMGDDGQKYFLHITEFQGGWQSLIQAAPTQVDFEFQNTPKGLRATNCSIVERK